MITISDIDRVFVVTIIRGDEPGKFGIGIAEHIDKRSVWIASIYETDISNRMALATACGRINNELKEGQRALVVISKFRYYQVIDAMRNRNPRLSLTVRGKQIYETYSLAKDALRRRETLIMEV